VLSFFEILGSADAPIGILHIAVHASYYNLDPLLAHLNLGGDAIAAAELRGVRKAALAGGLVFLNACEAGSWGAHLAGASVGLAGAFLENGASAVIAPLWSVDDLETLEMAKRILTRIWRGEPIAHVLRDARHTERQTIDPLAYILWGDVAGAFPARDRAT
jgi:CHAT domain-containing protein